MLTRTLCNRDCPDACSILVEVEGGSVISHRGDPAHGATRGTLCSQGRDFLRRIDAPDRLLHPLRRTSRGFERIAWDDALDLIAEALLRVRTAHGPLSVLALRYSGLRGRVGRALTRLFWAHFGGATFGTGGTCVESLVAAQRLDFGERTRIAHSYADFANARAIVLFGRNPSVTHRHALTFLKKARAKGAPVVAIDPLPTASARRADRHLALRPGTDRILALGVGRAILEAGGVDLEFARTHTRGFEAYRSVCESRDLGEVARITDLPRAAIEALARLYIEQRPVATLVGLGVAGWAHGGEAMRAIDALAALSGNTGIAGGGVTVDLEEIAGLDDTDLGLPEPGQSRSVRIPLLGDDLLAASDPPIRLGFIAGANPAATSPAPAQVARGFCSLELLVVVEQFMTATAALADLVLPCTTCFETDDLLSAYGHDWIGLSQRVIPPRGETRSDAEILQALAERLGFGPALQGDADLWITRLLGPLASEGLDLKALRAGPRLNPRTTAVPLADRRFGTPSGKIELLRAASPYSLPPDGALHLLATKGSRSINSQVLAEDLPALPTARAHPRVLAARGLQGEAFVVSRVGRVRARLEPDERLRLDVVTLGPVRWQGDLVGVNQLREALMSDLGDCAAMHETLVTLEPAD